MNFERRITRKFDRSIILCAKVNKKAEIKPERKMLLDNL